MAARMFLGLLAACVLNPAIALAQEPLVTYKSLSPEIALDLARAALGDCQRRGYQVAVAIVDRFGVVQVVLRDRFAGAHTPSTAQGKAWTAATFRTNTTDLNSISQPGMMQAGIRLLPGVVIIGEGSLSNREDRLSVPSASRARRAVTPMTLAPRSVLKPSGISSTSDFG